MLSINLAETLINKRLLTINSQVQLESGLEKFTIKEIKKTDNGYVFHVISAENFKPRTINCEQVLMLDGMEPEIVAAAYDIMPNGSKKVLGKRRGRPRKHFRPEIEYILN